MSIERLVPYFIGAKMGGVPMRQARPIEEKEARPALPTRSQDWVYVGAAGVTPSVLLALAGRGALRALHSAHPLTYSYAMRTLGTPGTVAASGLGVVGLVSTTLFAMTFGPVGLAVLAGISSLSDNSRKVDELSKELKSLRSKGEPIASLNSASAATEDGFSPVGGLSCVAGAAASGLLSRTLIRHINRHRVSERLQKELTSSQWAEWLSRQETMAGQAAFIGVLMGFFTPVGMMPRC